MKIVTRWTHPDIDEALILAGTPDESLAEAAQYFEPTEPPTGKQEEMTEEAFLALPEFQG